SGFKTDFCRHRVPLSEFQSGGPGKGGIPALDHPRFAPASSVDWLAFREPVIELTVGRDVRAYPLQILIWHEIVNDRVGGVPVTITFCPLCNTAIAFDRRVRGRTLSFGTTGNLRNSDLVMYDRQTESWWQQFGGEALVGDYAGTTLRQLPARIVAWRDFEHRHPHGLVLTRKTGFSRPYGENPYTGYDDVSSPPFFPAAHAPPRPPPPRTQAPGGCSRRSASSSSSAAEPWPLFLSPCSSGGASSASPSVNIAWSCVGEEGSPPRSTQARSRAAATSARPASPRTASPLSSTSRSGSRSPPSGPTSASSASAAQRGSLRSAQSASTVPMTMPEAVRRVSGRRPSWWGRNSTRTRTAAIAAATSPDGKRSQRL